VNGSELIWTRATLAWAAGAPIQVARQEATVRASAAVSVRFMERLLLTLDWEREHSLPGGLVAERPEGKSTNGVPTLRSACTVFTDPQRFPEALADLRAPIAVSGPARPPTRGPIRLHGRPKQ